MKEQKPNGLFSTCFRSLKLQAETLFEEVGGEEACRLLDTISDLRRNERSLLLRVFCAAAREVVQKSKELNINDESQAKAMEDALFDQIFQAIKEVQLEKDKTSLTLIPGGNPRQIKSFHMLTRSKAALSVKPGRKRTGTSF